MKKITTLRKALLPVILCIAFAANGQQSGLEVMKLVDQRPDGDTRKSITKMELVNKRGRTRVRTMLSYSKDYGKDKKSIMFFEQPADVKGTGFLTWDYREDSKTDDRWLYLPAMKKTRRISGTSAKKEYFMGSDFTYDDMGNRDVEADKHILLRQESANGKKWWVVESTPLDDDGMYSKRISWIDRDTYLALKVEYYDKQGAKMKILEVNNTKKVDGIWVATRMTMNHLQRSHKTVISLESVEINIPIDDQVFTVNSLEKGYIQ